MHFTPRDGRVGDLFGVLRVDGRYQLFYEHRTTDERAAGWGSAVSDDLVIWRERGTSAAPGAPGDPRCGSVVDGPAGPVMFHSRAGEGVWRATSGPELDGWRAEPARPVLGADPAGFAGLRDPFVWAVDGGWRMLVVASPATGGSAVLQYRSADLLTWDHDGVLTTGETAGWRCPRLFELDGAWVLFVAGVAPAYAIGSYDGLDFVPRVWGVFEHGSLGPVTPFLDAAGRRCFVARVSESSCSVPWILTLRDERLIATPHPHLDKFLVNGVAGLTASDGTVRDHGDVILRMPAGGETTVLADADLVEVTVEGVSGLGAARRVFPGDPGAHIARLAE
ncbi:hypothetical protein Acy02nite_26570 [Actinoplanes cyaneus]|uniref:beta-fructofuranosidase n=1 Tax=Actinoplanes cyaneus TaxID=52696 RepID=A0A919MB63_9ACTN|nr:glycoside hydrolase family 32 protein [Actinoplanes cyaneus]MCW2138016.1 beta-fructofuranosidase [Actinoplanes cyaneus]GID64776.1 hypothetical protein Acy02nite_26570 [Actinoplanes cyaneus]